ncbi:MAG: hypothetical protein ACOX33_10110 [Dethiobacteria bacterium]|jgi:hypothetical protein
MEKAQVILWYIGVVAAAVLLVAAFIWKIWVFTVFAFILGLLLKKTNRRIPLPAVYEELGVVNEIFEGRVRNEKNN